VHRASHWQNWARAINCDGPYGVGLLAACAALLTPLLDGGVATGLLRYDRAAIAAGQWWRLLTAHIIHLGIRHAALNTLGLALLWALFAREWRPRQWILIILIVTIAIDGGLWLRDPHVSWYVGASGVLHGLMAAGGVAYVRRGDPFGLVVAGFLAAKLIYEHLEGPLPFTGNGVPVILDAHLLGALGGLLAAVLLTAARPRGHLGTD
jgi:rhomboid family GlyGly-CTERM serine protease